MILRWRNRQPSNSRHFILTMSTMRLAAPLLKTLLLSHTDDPGGDIDDPGDGSTNDWGSFSNFTTSASTLSKTPALYVSSSLTTRVSFLKSAADVVKCTDMDYSTGSFCSSCSIPPLTAGGLWSTGKGCAMCDYVGCFLLILYHIAAKNEKKKSF